jgi:hypothetical protein
MVERTAMTKYQRLVRLIAITFPLAGIALLLAGTVGDNNHFWDGRPFLTNVFSSAATALFGVPLALLFFSKLANESLLENRREFSFRQAQAAMQRVTIFLEEFDAYEIERFANPFSFVTVPNDEFQDFARVLFGPFASRDYPSWAHLRGFWLDFMAYEDSFLELGLAWPNRKECRDFGEDLDFLVTKYPDFAPEDWGRGRKSPITIEDVQLFTSRLHRVLKTARRLEASLEKPLVISNHHLGPATIPRTLRPKPRRNNMDVNKMTPEEEQQRAKRRSSNRMPPPPPTARGL